jgi:hypothetical protein
MDRKVYAAVMEKSEGYCFVCHKYFGEQLELHHILRRKGVEADINNCVMLCNYHHRDSKAGAHGNHQLDLKLKLQLQELYFSQGLDEDEVRIKMGNRLYIEEE